MNRPIGVTMHRPYTRSIMVLLASCTIVAACGTHAPADDDAPDDTTDNTAQIANPASQHCIDQGGTLDIVDEAAGQVGYCVLPDGTRVEEWEFFRSAND